MSRAGLLDHRKFKKLVHLLKQPVPHCVGYLECLWIVAYQARSSFVGDPLDVGLATQFPGDQDTICEALSAAGFIDKRADGKYEVHDLEDHAPQHVRRAIERRRKEVSWANESIAVGDEPANGKPLASHQLANGLQEKRVEKRKEKNKNPPIPPLLDGSEVFHEAWRLWQQHRKENRGPLTPTAMAQQLKELERLGAERAVKAIRFSIRQCYAGIFEETAEKTKPAKQRALTSAEISDLKSLPQGDA